MPEEPNGIDHYEVVLADLYAKRDQILQAIAAIESLRGGPSDAAQTRPGSETLGKTVDGPGALLGLSIVDAARKLLAAKRQPLRNPEIAALFKAGGLVLNSREPANTIGSVLTRRFAEVGDVVRVDRGTWGLKEWYPNRSFGKKDAKVADKGGD
ncbi:MAG: winged helix-turn-helix domain-containing protein [Xanthobacteraceae bacterium]